MLVTRLYCKHTRRDRSSETHIPRRFRGLNLVVDPQRTLFPFTNSFLFFDACFVQCRYHSLRWIISSVRLLLSCSVLLQISTRKVCSRRRMERPRSRAITLSQQQRADPSRKLYWHSYRTQYNVASHHLSINHLEFIPPPISMASEVCTLLRCF